MSGPKDWRFKALTPLWTGNVWRNGEQLIPTGIMGSLRWWYEVLVRGLGGEACDPTAKAGDLRCPDKDGKHCVACELFGCTGWARKFRLMVLEENGEVMQEQIGAGTVFILRFIPLRPIRDEEWCLLDLTLRLIADYGAIGGRTVFKPSEEWGIADLDAEDLEENNGQVTVRRSRHGLPLRRGDVILEVEGSRISSLADLESTVSMRKHGNPLKVKIRRQGREEEIDAWAGKRHHQDFGLIQVVERPNDLPSCTCKKLEEYIQQGRWRRVDHDDFAWASLQNFWCVKGRYLARQSFTSSTYNRVLGRNTRKNQAQSLWQDTKINRWLAGRQQESKKIFSFKHPTEEGRTFGFVKPNLVDFDEMKLRLGQVWQNFNPDEEFLIGKDILNQLLQQEEKV